MFSKALVRTPPQTMSKGITTSNLGAPNYEKALQQHKAYISALGNSGLNVTILDTEPGFPDSMFVEDVALLTPECAILTCPGAPSRRGEVALIRQDILYHFDKLHTITPPGTIEAGDIMMVGKHYFLGLSDRSNLAGARQLKDMLHQYGLTVSTVAMHEFLHLKTGVSYLENNTVLVTGELIDHDAFAHLTQICIDPDEQNAANSVWINDNVLTPAGNPKTSKRLKQAGYKVIELDVSEFQKLDGGLSCLSLRF